MQKLTFLSLFKHNSEQLSLTIQKAISPSANDIYVIVASHPQAEAFSLSTERLLYTRKGDIQIVYFNKFIIYNKTTTFLFWRSAKISGHSTSLNAFYWNNTHYCSSLSTASDS